MDSPLYVEKGVLDDPDHPLLLNKEGLMVNQIKTKETLLQDKSKCAWLVAYLKKGGLDAAGKKTDMTVRVEGAPGNYIQLASTIENWKFYDYSILNPNMQPMLVTDAVKLRVKGGWLAGSGPSFTYFHTDTSSTTGSSSTDYDTYTRAEDIPNIIIANPSPWGFDQKKKLNKKLSDAWNDFSGFDSIMSSVRTDFSQVKSRSTFNELQNIVNVGRLRDSSGRYFKVNYSKKSTSSALKVDSTKATMFNIMNVVAKNALGYTLTPNANCFAIIPIDGELITIELVEESEIEARAVFPTTPEVTNNPLYDIICMPYIPDGTVTYKINNTKKKVDSEVNLISLYDITTQLGGNAG